MLPSKHTSLCAVSSLERDDFAALWHCPNCHRLQRRVLVDDVRQLFGTHLQAILIAGDVCSVYRSSLVFRAAERLLRRHQGELPLVLLFMLAVLAVIVDLNVA